MKTNTKQTMMQNKTGYGIKVRSSLPEYDGIELTEPEFTIPGLPFYLVKASNGTWFIRFFSSQNALIATDVDVALWKHIAAQNRTIAKLTTKTKEKPIATKTK